MFLVLDNADHEYYRTGEIVLAVGNCYLIQFNRLELDQPQPPAELCTLEELTSTCENCGQKRAIPDALLKAKKWAASVEVADNSWLQILLDGRSIRSLKPGSF